jgi:hypothetical protein
MKESELICLICEHWNGERYMAGIALDKVLEAIRVNYTSPEEPSDDCGLTESDLIGGES